MAESPAARVLSRVVDVRSGEVPGLLAAFAYHFLLFTAYYILRPIRDSMGVAGGVENLDDLFGWTLLGMLAAVPLFGWISGRFRRAVFLPWTYLFFVAQLVAFWAVFTASEHYAATARVFFVWVSVFNLFVIAVFWSFMADLFDKEQGKRVLAFFVPMFVFVALSVTLGMYLAMLLYLVFAMRFQGRFGWLPSLATALGTAAFFYFGLEKFAQVTLLKGPVEAMLGL